AMTWDDRVSFELTEGLQLRKINFLEGTAEGAPGSAKEDNFDADAAIATGELGQLMPELIEALGGEMQLGAAPPEARAPKAAAPATEELADESAPF
ncbi:exonuclease, partial [Massilia sp. JS1662]